MSRLIVKGLPAHCTETSLRTFYEKYGTLNDCTLKYTKEGKFRKFAFVGFDNDEIANIALKETNQVYMGSSRLQVEICKPFGDCEKPRAWSQYSKDSSAYKRKHGTIDNITSKKQKEVVEQSESNTEVDPEFQKFLQSKGVESTENKTVMKDTDVASSADLIQELRDGISGKFYTVIFLVYFEHNVWCSSALVSFNRPPDVRRVLQRDQQFIGGYKVTINKIEEDQPEYMENIDDQDQIRDNRETGEEILETGRLFVRNLPFKTLEEDLYFLFKKYGEISDVQKTGACKGFAIIEFVFPESAVAAFGDLDGKIFKGRILHILAGAERRDSSNTNEEVTTTKDSQKSSFKKEKQAKLKSSAHKVKIFHFYFMLDNTVILAKNLPAGVHEEELRRMFEKFGAVDKLLLPPECAISALIVMGNAVDAKRAFQGLAYSRFRTQPLYLEWAPGDVFGEINENKLKNDEPILDLVTTSQDIEKEARNKRKATYEEKKRKKDLKAMGMNINKQDPEVMKSSVDEETESCTTVFVKNLSFTTTDDSLDKIFSMIFISRMYKLLDCGKLLDGHCLELKISHRDIIERDSVKRKALNTTEQGKCTKLLIKNLPFQAKIKEIESLFATFGEIKNIRIPKKQSIVLEHFIHLSTLIIIPYNEMGGKDQHRGFGFVDFISVSEATRAFEALVHSTHLYGRRLVLEWAKEEESIEELRERTAEKFWYAHFIICT
uniref:RNA-binding protein 19 n=1 Tax=Heterorhabditis bacteriophora TaxID=37862 RepID=A0A1I7WIK5_HETBA